MQRLTDLVLAGGRDIAIRDQLGVDELGDVLGAGVVEDQRGREFEPGHLGRDIASHDRRVVPVSLFQGRREDVLADAVHPVGEIGDRDACMNRPLNALGRGF